MDPLPSSTDKFTRFQQILRLHVPGPLHLRVALANSQAVWLNERELFAETARLARERLDVAERGGAVI